MSSPTHRCPALIRILLCAAPGLAACPGEPAATTASEPTATAASSSGLPTDPGTSGELPTSGEPPGTSGEPPTSGEPSGSSSEPVTASTGEPCPPGSRGCACLMGQVCDDPLVCIDDLCSEPTAGCGDGVLDRGEGCDDGRDNGPGNACKADCTVNVCGDGDLGPGEACDDGDTRAGDGCSAGCQLELCGDGMVDPGEACDDGNLVAGDGCEADCSWTPCSVVWEVSHADPDGSLHGKKVATDANGDIVIVATLRPAQVDSRLLTLKLDPAGALIWAQEAADLRMDGNGLAITADGGIVGIGVEYEQPFLRDLARRFAPDGAPGWLTQNIAAQSSQGFGAAMTPDGAVIAAGFRQVQTTSIPWLARLDADTGAVLWSSAAQIPGTTGAQHLAVAVDAAGAIYTTGVVWIGDDPRLLVRKLGPDGVQQWMVAVENPGAGFARGWDIEPTPAGGVAVTGEFFYGGGAGGDLWVGVFDGDGAPLWSDVHNGGPGESYDVGYGVAVGPRATCTSSVTSIPTSTSGPTADTPARATCCAPSRCPGRARRTIASSTSRSTATASR
ncbi:DUF4215 domain-containing protein [Nannocystis sp.]|uniref:DUF4215 domain-containing protein n=1 Tax=Nannocystis sp. TaxID=1962667 RepID=UPI0025EF7497|nr:DUF4215 domain-containing protein [Nannocystis sp.]